MADGMVTSIQILEGGEQSWQKSMKLGRTKNTEVGLLAGRTFAEGIFVRFCNNEALLFFGSAFLFFENSYPAVSTQQVERAGKVL
jgi:threonine/homoserine/homoserine lactone efflux protein